MEVIFKFSPMQYVYIRVYDLGYRARIIACKFDGHKESYCVEYAADGVIHSKEFYEDELEAA